MSSPPDYILSEDVKSQFGYDCGLSTGPMTEFDKKTKYVSDLFKKYLLEALDKYKPIFKLTEAENKIITMGMQDYVEDILMKIIGLVPPKTDETLKEIIKQHVFKIIRDKIRPLKNTKIILSRDEFLNKLETSEAAVIDLLNEETNKNKANEQQKKLAAKRAAKRKRKNLAKKEQMIVHEEIAHGIAKEEIAHEIVKEEIVKEETAKEEIVKEETAKEEIVKEEIVDNKMFFFRQMMGSIDWTLDEDQEEILPVPVIKENVDDKLFFRQMTQSIDWTLDEDQEEIIPQKQTLSYAKVLKKDLFVK